MNKQLVKVIQTASPTDIDVKHKSRREMKLPRILQKQKESSVLLTSTVPPAGWEDTSSMPYLGSQPRGYQVRSDSDFTVPRKCPICFAVYQHEHPQTNPAELLGDQGSDLEAAYGNADAIYTHRRHSSASAASITYPSSGLQASSEIVGGIPRSRRNSRFLEDLAEIDQRFLQSLQTQSLNVPYSCDHAVTSRRRRRSAVSSGSEIDTMNHGFASTHHKEEAQYPSEETFQMYHLNGVRMNF